MSTGCVCWGGCVCLNVTLRALDGPRQRKSVVARGDHERGKRRQGGNLTEANRAAKR